MENFASSHAIIKALKGVEDPPLAGGLSKIEIARKAWESSAIHFLSKDEVLAEWILTSFIKYNKDVGGSSVKGLVLSSEYWALLGDVLTSGSPSQPARRNKPWLSSLCARIPILSVLTIFFKCAAYTDLSEHPNLMDPLSRAIHAMWPQAAVRMNLDALTDCLGSMLEYIASEHAQLNGVGSIGLLLTRSFKQAVGNTTGKKKAFSWFVEHSFLSWVHLVCLEPEASITLNRDSEVLVSEVYQGGVDVFFCLDSLKGSGSSDPLEAILTDPKYSLTRMRESQLQIVPLLYESYVHELRKHSSAVFGSGSNQTRDQIVQNKLRDAGVRTFGVCYRALRECGDTREVWKNVLTLVEALEEANLVGYGLTERTDVLNEIVGSASEILVKSKDLDKRTVDTALQVLSAVARIDFDFLSPILPEVLCGLRSLSSSVYPSTQSLLHIILDFYSKTRMVPTYLGLLLTTLRDADGRSTASVAHQCYTSGALLSLGHLGELSQCVRGFLTPGQTQGVLDSSLGILQDAWAKFSMCGDVRRDKTYIVGEMDLSRTKNGTQDATDITTPSLARIENSALQYSLISRAIAVILPSLPYSSLSEAASLSIQSGVSNALEGVLTEAARTAYRVPARSDERWAAQCISAATLRVRHAVLTCPALYDAISSNRPLMTAEETVGHVGSAVTIPELVIELLRVFFDADLMSVNTEERRTVIDALLTYLETKLVVENIDGPHDPHAEPLWDGSSSSLSSLEPGSHKRGALAVWNLLLDRWLPFIDEFALQEQLRRMVKLLLTRNQPVLISRESGQLSLDWLLDRVLNSAVFWELPSLRDALISIADSNIQHAGWINFSTLLKTLRDPDFFDTISLPDIWTDGQVQSVLRTFSVLLRAPRGYLSRNARITFVRRALVADLYLSRLKHETPKGREVVIRRTMVVVRAWVTSMSDLLDIVDIISDQLQGYVDYLTRWSPLGDEVDADFDAVTNDLLSMLFREAIRSAMHGKPNLVENLCAPLQNASFNLSERARLLFIETLLAECPDVKKLPVPTGDAIGRLYSDIRGIYSGALSMMPSQINRRQESIVRSWKTCVMLGKWLNIQDKSKRGIELMQKMMAAQSHISAGDEAKLFCTQALLLVLEELNSMPGDEREQHLSVMVAAYILLIGRLRLVDGPACDVVVERTARSLSVNEFAHVLNLLCEALRKGLASNSETQAAVHLSSVVVGDAPEGSMKVTQEHFEDCLNIFCDGSQFTSGDPELTLEVLEFIGKVCSEKPSYLRHLAFGPIWLLLSKILRGSTAHTQESHTTVLHSITSIAGSLIRLRRDLATSTLPHLGMVLSSLIRSLGAPRAQLGARQRTQVSDTLPWWVSPSTPLGVPEARAVARLLTTLQAKTIPRTFTSRDKSKTKDKERTAESLLGAFSKHVGPVMGAYIDMLVDPLVAADPNMREALAPGLYALCEAMGEHGRDAFMVAGCDAAGRTVFKSLWKDYDKQRYVGKG